MNILFKFFESDDPYIFIFKILGTALFIFGIIVCIIEREYLLNLWSSLNQ